MSSNTTYLITGANRGLGLGLTAIFLARPNNTVVAAVRTPSNADSVASLKSLPVGASSKLILVKIDSLSETDAAAAVQLLQAEHGITALDVVIANSGIANYVGPAVTTPLHEMRAHFEVNTLGPLVLFQATAALLEAAHDGKFFVMSTGGASIGDMMPFPGTAYSSSKAAVNFITRKIHFEHEKITSVALIPGWVQTDMGDATASTLGLPRSTLTVKESVAGLVKIIDTATRAETSGTFASYDGSICAW
ncbi:putative aflatoxin biosynthesis ketoreductase nor-1 [Athelia psychrophila]|uniref:Aflatoxin biosynthesis ketoreductase nor-1 n=1 Tax=Athelia psychrophila TaxID=1759441 RepID=A0A166J211_9AGAM|nr:putative aflatoxin biosynthesis ketoreductase nor-1 [Fibularhizoctonia sp. CBS 109695]